MLNVWGSGTQMRVISFISTTVLRALLPRWIRSTTATPSISSTGIVDTSFIGFACTAAKLCGYSTGSLGNCPHQPAGVYARGGDTRKQIALGFDYKIDFATGVKRALYYYSRYSSPIDAASVPLIPEIPRRTAARMIVYPI